MNLGIPRTVLDDNYTSFHQLYAVVLCTGLATKGSESATTGTVSSFSVGSRDQCGVLHGDYRFLT